MGNISPQKLVTLISQYLDREKLIKENPSVTKEMIDALLQDIFTSKLRKEPTDIHKSHHETAKHKEKEATDLIIHTDGASRGNPGKAGIGVAIFGKDYHLLEEICKFIGESTNNVAEYQAMILAAQKAVAYNARRVTFKTDSELLVRQINGAYRVKSQNILPLYHELTVLLGKIPEWKIQHVCREENVCADALANQGIDSSRRQITA
ncbi:MAG: ribonuclease HI family protein [Candidatus Brocadiaceae bacterium]|nr:ribonuclease HI family protein [Candidatus Brocadiaceae bacterium]